MIFSYIRKYNKLRDLMNEGNFGVEDHFHEMYTYIWCSDRANCINQETARNIDEIAFLCGWLD